MARRKQKRPHNTGSIRLRGGRAQVQWSENGKRRTRTVDLADAQSFLARANAGLEARQAAPAPSGRLADLAETWLAGRAEMASNHDDRNRWKNHLLPVVGEMEPNQVDVPVLKKLIVTLRQKGLSKGTVRLCVALLSSLYGDLVEDGVAKLNPTKLLSRKTRMNELRPERDWKKTPFIRDVEDIRRIHTMLHLGGDTMVARAYAIGVLAGLRTNEIRALRWEHIDWDQKLIHVQDQVQRHGGGVKHLKDKESRLVPLTDTLAAILEPSTRGEGLVCSDFGDFLDLHRIGRAMKSALASLELPAMRFYDATRHTYASQWVMAGGSLETLQRMMGHASFDVTQRYVHLVPGLYSDTDRARQIEMSAGQVSGLAN